MVAGRIVRQAALDEGIPLGQPEPTPLPDETGKGPQCTKTRQVEQDRAPFMWPMPSQTTDPVVNVDIERLKSSWWGDTQPNLGWGPRAQVDTAASADTAP